MNQTRFLSLLGLCAKAGKCLAGDTACFGALKSGDAKLVLVMADTAENTAKKAADACAWRSVPLLTCDNIDSAVGKPGRKVFAVTDANFAEKLLELHENPSNDIGGTAQ